MITHKGFSYTICEDYLQGYVIQFSEDGSSDWRDVTGYTYYRDKDRGYHSSDLDRINNENYYYRLKPKTTTMLHTIFLHGKPMSVSITMEDNIPVSIKIV